MQTLSSKTFRSATCYHCGRIFQASTHAITLTCPHCYKRVGLQDLIIHGLHSSKTLETAGLLIVEKKAWLKVGRIHVGERIEVEGRVEATAFCEGPVILGPRSHWTGDLTAPSIHISPGAIITGGYFRIGL